MAKDRPTAPEPSRPRLSPRRAQQRDDAISKMLSFAIAACRRRGYPTHDPEFGGVIAGAVWRAYLDYDPSRGMLLTTHGCRYALNDCGDLARRVHSETTRIAQLNENTTVAAAIPLPQVELTEFESELLAYVAVHGHKRTAKDLQISPAELQNRLSLIRSQVHKQVTNA